MIFREWVRGYAGRGVLVTLVVGVCVADAGEVPAGMAFGKKGFDPQSLYITHRYGISKVSIPAGRTQ